MSRQTLLERNSQGSVTAVKSNELPVINHLLSKINNIQKERGLLNKGKEDLEEEAGNSETVAKRGDCKGDTPRCNSYFSSHMACSALHIERALDTHPRHPHPQQGGHVGSYTPPPYQGSGQDSGFRVQGSGFRVQGLGFRV